MEIRKTDSVKRQQIESQWFYQKLLPQVWFMFLLLFCLMAIILCFALTNNSLSWSEGFKLHYKWSFNNTFHIHVVNQINPRHNVSLNEIYKTTDPPTEASQGVQYHQAFPHNYHFLLDNTEICKKEAPFLILMVPVEPSNLQARDAIRQTWGKERQVQGKLVVTLFMLGLSGEDDSEKLKQENLQHHDLIQSNFMDTYLNLTIKTMVIMDWLAIHCSKTTYAMKVDSDMFLNIDNLVIMLQKPEVPKLNYLTGMLMWDRPVVRSKDSVWYVAEELFPDPKYPTYTLGMGYVFSNDLPQKFVEVSKFIKPFNIEDAYIGMCMKKLGLTPTSPPDPSQFKTYNIRYDRCEYSKIITYILGSPQELVNYWTEFKKPGAYC